MDTETIGAQAIRDWMTEIADSVHDDRGYLTQLDAAIGDGDHGVNMDRGFTAVIRALSDPNTEVLRAGELLQLAGNTLLATVGGASGPLWGTAFRSAGRALGEATRVPGRGLADCLDAAVCGVVELGAAEPGDKTMVDALRPAADELRHSVEAGRSLGASVEAAATAAEAGARATVPMQARKGRASYLGERSIGHQDPGATSAGLVIRALQRVVAPPA